MSNRRVHPLVWVIIGLGLGVFLMVHLQWKNQAIAKAIENVKSSTLSTPTLTLPAPTSGPSPMTGTNPRAILAAIVTLAQVYWAKFIDIKQKTTRKAKEAIMKFNSPKSIAVLILIALALSLFVGMLIPGRSGTAEGAIAPFTMGYGDQLIVSVPAPLGDGGLESGTQFRFEKVGTSEFIEGIKGSGDIYRQRSSTVGFTTGTWVLKSKAEVSVNLASGKITIRRWRNPTLWAIGAILALLGAVITLAWGRITLPKFVSKKTPGKTVTLDAEGQRQMDQVAAEFGRSLGLK